MILNYKDGNRKVLKDFSELEKETKEKFDELSDIKVWNIKNVFKEHKRGIHYNYARLFMLDQYSKEEALEILEECLKDNRLKEIVEKIIIYNLDIETYQILKEEKFMMETTFEIATSGIRNEALKIGEERGEKRGIKIGEKRGEKRGKLETAFAMLKEGLDMELVQKVTGLTEKQIQEYHI